MRHLTPDEVVDAVEDALPAERGTHLASCPTCRASVDELARLLYRTRRVTVPEPSPLFWNHFSSRVRAAIESESSPAPVGTSAWLRWSVLVPFGALALLVATLTATIPATLETTPRETTPSGTRDVGAARMSDEDVPWAFVSAIVGEVSLDDAQRAGLVIAPGAAERAAADLTAQEREELLRLLAAALEHR